MPVVQQPKLENRILARLSAEDFSLLADHLKLTDYPIAMALAEPQQIIPYVIFPESCVISIVAHSAEGQAAECGLIGREGLAPSAVILGTDQVPHRYEIQIAGQGHRIGVAEFLEATDRSRTLRTSILRFVQSLSVQTAYTALSNASHPVEERLARWLLMCHDRSASDDLRLTHKFMSVMLAVRRASVTTALQTLEGCGFIQAQRGYVLIANRPALEDFAGDAYGPPEAEYRRLLGPL